MESYNEIVEKNLLDRVRQKEEADRRLLTTEIVIVVLLSVILFTLVFVASFVEIEAWIRILLIVLGIIPFMTGILFAIRIEQVAGYYECQNCHHKYIPAYSSDLWARHVNRTRYMRCPKCDKKSWKKKVISK